MSIASEPWRRRCPNGHVNIKYRTGAGRGGGPEPKSPYYCRSCDKAGVDPHHDHIVDVKTGREITR